MGIKIKIINFEKDIPSFSELEAFFLKKKIKKFPYTTYKESILVIYDEQKEEVLDVSHDHEKKWNIYQFMNLIMRKL